VERGRSPAGRAALGTLALAAAALLVWAPYLGAPFVWDDEGLVTRNPHIRTFHGALGLIAKDLYWGKSAGNYYRPVQALTNAGDYALFGLHPWGYHLTNVLLHAGVAVLLWRLFAQWTGRGALAFAAPSSGRSTRSTPRR